MAVDVSSIEFNTALWKRFKGGKIRNVYPLAKYNDIVEKIKAMEKNPPCNTPGEYYLLRKFVVANIDGKERLCCKPENCSVFEKTVDSTRCELKFYVALEEIYNCIDEVHRCMIHGGKDRIVRSLQKKGVVNITRETVELYLSFCKVCRPQKKEVSRKTKIVTVSSVNKRICDSPVNNISSESEGADRFCLVNNVAITDKVEVPTTESRSSDAYFSLNRSYVDLIDFSSSPDGDYRFVFLYLDLQTNFCVLHPVRCKCTFEIVSHLLDIFTLLGPPQVLHSNFEESFILQVINEIKLAWPELLIVTGTMNYLEIQEVAGNCVTELHSMLKSWLSENNSKRWSAALRFIQLRRNTGLVNNAKSPYECLFGKSMSLNSKLLPQIDATLLKQVTREDDLMNLISNQSEHYESLQISLDPNICSFVQNHTSQDSHGEEELTMPKRRKAASLGRKTRGAAGMRSIRAQRTEEQHQQDNTNVRVGMAQLRQAESEDARAERNEQRRLERRQARRFIVNRRRANEQQRQQIMALTPAEKQKRYRERRRLNAEKEEENKRKDRERWRKRVPIKEMSASAQRAQRKCWRSTQRKCRQIKAENILASAIPCTSSNSERIIESSIIKAEPISDSENLTNGIELSESSNDGCSSPNFGNLEIVIKQEKDDS